jgi:hypothetical protein
MQQLNIIEVDARLHAIRAQRDEALNQVVLYAGRLAVLEAEVVQLRKRIDAVNEEIPPPGHNGLDPPRMLRPS